jgi:hypothetical protein
LFGGMDIDMDGAMFLCLLVFYGSFLLFIWERWTLLMRDTKIYLLFVS